MHIVTYGLIFWGGIFVGFFIRSWMISRFRNYSGTLVVEEDQLHEKTVYSLILDDYPDELKFQKTLVLRVDNSAKSSDRK